MEDKENLLDRIFSNKKRKEIGDILNTRYPAHFQRVYLAGFLKYAVGLSEEEICLLIKERCKWGDYEPKITEAAVRSVRKQTHTEAQLKKEHLSKGAQTIECLRPSFSSPINPPKWVGIENACGFVLEWVREEEAK